MKYLLHFLWKNSAFLLFLFLELISLIVLVNYNRYQSTVFSSMANQYGGKIFTSYSSILNYLHLKEANELLSLENATLRRRLQAKHIAYDSAYATSFSKMDSSTVLKKDSSSPLFDYISAKIISNSIHRQRNYFMLNKGSNHGIKKNMGVIGPNGIVGVIFETSGDFSSGISLLNIKQSVSAKIKKNNELGSIVWDGVSREYGQLDAIENYVPIAIGDTIITSGYSHIFPGGENIGTIAEFSEIPGKTSWRIRVKFNTNYSALMWVNVARNLNYEQQMALEAIELKN